jgi:hypothetical protein
MILTVFHCLGTCLNSSDVNYNHSRWSPAASYSSLQTRKLISSLPSALSGLLLKIALSTSCFVRHGHLRGRAWWMVRRALLFDASGIGGVGKKASIRAFAFSSSDWYLSLSTDSSKSSYNQRYRTSKQLDSTFCTLSLKTRSKRFYRSSSLSFVCTICLYLLKYAYNLSLRPARPTPYLYVLKFSPTLSSRAALSVVPARHASTLQP